MQNPPANGQGVLKNNAEQKHEDEDGSSMQEQTPHCTVQRLLLNAACRAGACSLWRCSTCRAPPATSKDRWHRHPPHHSRHPQSPNPPRTPGPTLCRLICCWILAVCVPMGSELANFFSVTDSQSDTGSVVSWNCFASTRMSSSCFCL